jgi:hypothetical protein
LHATRITVATLAISVTLAGCASDEGSPTSSPPEPSTTDSSTTLRDTASPLEGNWRTKPISAADGEATLRRYGLSKYIPRFRPLSPLTANAVLLLEIRKDWDLSIKSKGKPPHNVDYDADYDVYGNKVDKIHATGSTTYRWSVDGDTLTFEWLRSTEPAYRGIPDEVFSRVLYMTTEFTRQG